MTDDLTYIPRETNLCNDCMDLGSFCKLHDFSVPTSRMTDEEMARNYALSKCQATDREYGYRYHAFMAGMKAGRKDMVPASALKHEVEKVDQIIAGAIMKERERCAEIARDCHGCSGLQTAKAILNPPKDEAK